MNTAREAATFRLPLRIAISVASAAVVCSCSAQEASPSADWRNECIGRMQLSLPGSVDVAVTPEKTLLSEFRRGTQQPPTTFSDGQRAGFSDLRFGGVLMIARPVSNTSFASMTAEAKAARQRSSEWVSKSPKTNDGILRRFLIPQTTSPHGIAWQINTSYTYFSRVGDAALYWTVDAEPGNSATAIAFSAIQEAEPRPVFSVPKTVGVCVPYAFIPDDGQRWRDIGVTYRLKDQPDVTVWLADSNASAPGPDQIASHFTAEYKTNFFWTQDYQSRKKVKLLWRKLHDVQLDGRKGVSSFVELTRDDDTIDYGYLAVVRGDPDAKTDTPNLMLYVISDAKNAKDKGIEPISKEALLEMAQTIAASVKRRPVQ